MNPPIYIYHAMEYKATNTVNATKRTAHDGKVECNTVEYKTVSLYPDWLYFLWHGIKHHIDISTNVIFVFRCRYENYMHLTMSIPHYKFGKYCGLQTGQSLVITGDTLEIAFHSDSRDQKRRFLLHFTVVPVG